MYNELLNGRLASLKYRDYLKESEAERLIERSVKIEKKRYLYFFQLALQRIGLF